MTNADWWARVVQARTAREDLLPQRVWALRKRTGSLVFGRNVDVSKLRCAQIARMQNLGILREYASTTLCAHARRTVAAGCRIGASHSEALTTAVTLFVGGMIRDFRSLCSTPRT